MGHGPAGLRGNPPPVSLGLRSRCSRQPRLSHWGLSAPTTGSRGSGSVSPPGKNSSSRTPGGTPGEPAGGTPALQGRPTPSGKVRDEVDLVPTRTAAFLRRNRLVAPTESGGTHQKMLE